MVLPTDPASYRRSRTGIPSRTVRSGSEEYELYERDGEFVLSVEMPGYDVEDIEVGWHDGRLTVAAEHEDPARERTRTYRRSFRMPKTIDDEDIRVRYENGILDVYLPTVAEDTVQGKTIPIEG